MKLTAVVGALTAIAVTLWVAASGATGGTLTPPYDVSTGRVVSVETRNLGNGYTAKSTLRVGPGVHVILNQGANAGIPAAAQTAASVVSPQFPIGDYWVEDGIEVDNGVHQRAWEWHHQLKWHIYGWQVVHVPWNQGVPIADDWGWQYGGAVYNRTDSFPASSIWAYSKGRENFCIPYCWKTQYPWMNFRVNGAGNLTGENWGVDGG